MALFLSRNVTRHASRLVYSEYGVPTEVVKLEKFDQPVVTDEDDVVIKMLAAPIHPADINIIQGTYGMKSVFPAVCGGEGVGRVLDVGAKVVSLRPGDVVFPTGNMSGTWTSHYKSKESGFMKVSDKLDTIAAATLRTNPATAYRMLKDFVNPEEGDVVIQNGSNSAVGTAVIQICKVLNLKTVNVVRDRENLDELKSELHQLGADHVLTEQELRQTKIFRDGLLPKPRLGLNCVGGQSSTDLMQCLGPKGVHVTYGGMSLKPVTASATALIFKDISFRGFWLSRWLDEHAGSDELFQMYDHLTEMSLKGQLIPPKHQLFDLSDHMSALEESTKGFKKGKVIFMMDN